MRVDEAHARARTGTACAVTSLQAPSFRGRGHRQSAAGGARSPRRGRNCGRPRAPRGTTAARSGKRALQEAQRRATAPSPGTRRPPTGRRSSPGRSPASAASPTGKLFPSAALRSRWGQCRRRRALGPRREIRVVVGRLADCPGVRRCRSDRRRTSAGRSSPRAGRRPRADRHRAGGSSGRKSSAFHVVSTGMPMRFGPLDEEARPRRHA
jgi:hypothetical protein